MSDWLMGGSVRRGFEAWNLEFKARVEVSIGFPSAHALRLTRRPSRNSRSRRTAEMARLVPRSST